MKKLFSSLFIVMMIALAFAAVASAEVYEADADGLYNIEYAIDAEDGTQFGMVVIEAAEDAAFALDEATIRYIDQVAAEDGAITFDAFAPMDLKNEGTYKVYIGGGDLAEATLIGTLEVATDEPGEGPTDPDEPGTEEPDPDEPDPDEPGTDEPTEPQGLLGDINGDAVVNIQDATYLFGYSMRPTRYPIDAYEGHVDFERDGAINIKDATYLFGYSMRPTRYPISWE